MIQEDFADFHNHASETLTAAWKLLWSLIIAMFHGLCLGAIWMRNLVDPKASPAWVQLAFYEPVKLKYQAVDWGFEPPISIRGNEMLKEEIILSDERAIALEVYGVEHA